MLQSKDDEIMQKNDEANGILQDNIRLSSEVKSLEEVKNAVEERLVNVRSECEDAKNQSILSSNRTEELEKERTIMLDYIKEMQSKIGDLESKIASDNKASSSKIRMLEDRLADMKNRDGDVTTKLEQAEKRIEQMRHVQKLTEQRLADEHVKNSNLQEHVELQSKDSATQLAATDALKEKILVLEDEKTMNERKLDLLRKSQEEKDLAMEDMLRKMDTLNSHISDLTMDKDASETRYRSELEGIMSELEKAVLDKERAESTMRQAVDKYENLTKEKNDAEVNLKAAQDDVLLLRENKGLLQKTMLEQLNGLRSEVKRLTVERDDAVEELLRIREEKDRVEILMNATKSTNLMYKSPQVQMTNISTTKGTPGSSRTRYNRNTTDHLEHVRSALKKYGGTDESIASGRSNRKQIHIKRSGSVIIEGADDAFTTHENL